MKYKQSCVSYKYLMAFKQSLSDRLSMKISLHIKGKKNHINVIIVIRSSKEKALSQHI